MNTSRLTAYAPVVVRIGMSLVFFYFSFSQFSDPSAWTGYVPQGVVALFGGNAVLLVLLNAWFELIFGLALFVGFQTRIAALLLALHLVGIAATIGISPVGVRDIGLAAATFSIFCAGADMLSLDRKFLAHQPAQVPNAR
ncbi:MAG: DoxX family protein [Candidatus Parcubacteria bacterium]|nr:DoxX family protein [Candidatus Parcubacteria bacterium]